MMISIFSTFGISVNAASKKAKKITLNKTTTTMYVKDSLKLSVKKVVPSNAKKTVKWTTSDKSIATVSNGKVTAKKAGTVTIKAISASNKKVSAKCKISVLDKTEKILLSCDKVIGLKVGQSLSLGGKTIPEKNTQPLKYTSFDTKVVKVSSKGVCDAVSPGSTIVRAMSGGKSEFIDVIVTEEGFADNNASNNESNNGNNSNNNNNNSNNSGQIVRPIPEPGNRPISGTTTEKTVSSLAELKEAIKNNTGKVIYKSTSDSSESISIPAGVHSNTDLVVNAPKATITNNAKFKSIKIESIAKDTWIEKATGNVIDIVATQAHVVCRGTSVINVSNKDSKVQVDVDTPVNVEIKGEAATNVQVNASAQGAVIKSEVPVELNATAKVTLELGQNAATGTKVNVSNANVVPNIVSNNTVSIEVKNETTGGVIQVPSTPDMPKGTISGCVAFKKNSPVNGEETGPVANAAVYVFPLSKYELQPELAMEEATSQIATTTNDTGQFSFENIEYGNYVVVVKADTYTNTFRTVSLVNSSAEMNFTLVECSSDTGSVYGVVKNAATGLSVGKDFDVAIRAGGNNIVGVPLNTMKTNENGAYRFEGLTPGQYTVEVSDNRGDKDTQFAHASFDLFIYGGVDSQRDVMINNRADNDELRFILTWGREDITTNEAVEATETKDEEDLWKRGLVPADLDSHLVGPGHNSDKSFHIFYMDRIYTTFEKDSANRTSENSEVDENTVARLDVDDVDYEGPETTSVYKIAPKGEYHFYVHNFSDGEDPSSTRISTSQARVEVYVKGVKVDTFEPPVSANGNLWDVCTYDPETGVVSAVNKMIEFDVSEEYVGASEDEINKARLEKKFSDLNYMIKEMQRAVDNIENTDGVVRYPIEDAKKAELKDKLKDATIFVESATLETSEQDIANVKRTLIELKEEVFESTRLDLEKIVQENIIDKPVENLDYFTLHYSGNIDSSNLAEYRIGYKTNLTKEGVVALIKSIKYYVSEETDNIQVDVKEYPGAAEDEMKFILFVNNTRTGGVENLIIKAYNVDNTVTD